MESQLETQIEFFIQPFIDFSTFQNAQFPLLPNTYTLWRKVCYKTLSQKYKCKQQSLQFCSMAKIFIQVSQRKLLQSFYKKIQKQIDGRSLGWRKAILQTDELKLIDSEEYQDLLLGYCQAVYQHELMIEMFYDLVSIPYTAIYDPNIVYLTNQKYKSSLYTKKNQTLADQACNKISKNIVSKGLSKLSETLLSNRAFYSMTGILGAFNPLASAASLSISFALESHQKHSKVQSLVEQLEYLKQSIEKNIQELKQTYDMCLTSISSMCQLEPSEVKELEREKKKVRNLIGTVLDEDWLQIKSTMDGQWEIVQLKNKFSQRFKVT